MTGQPLCHGRPDLAVVAGVPVLWCPCCLLVWTIPAGGYTRAGIPDRDWLAAAGGMLAGGHDDTLQQGLQLPPGDDNGA